MSNMCIKKNCRYYRNNTDIRGCTILKKLFCRRKIECIFYKKREKQEEKEYGVKV